MSRSSIAQRMDFGQYRGTGTSENVLLFLKARERPFTPEFIPVLRIYRHVSLSSFLLATDPQSVLAIKGLVEIVRHFPALAHLPLRCDFAQLRRLFSTQCDALVRLSRELGHEPIFVSTAIDRSEVDALLAWMQAARTRGEERLSLQEDCAKGLGLVANFLGHIESSRWTLGPFYELRQGVSMTSIVGQLIRKKLQLAAADDPVYAHLHLTVAANSGVQQKLKLWYFTAGVLKKARYLVELPEAGYFCQACTYSTEQECNNDPIGFIRRNMREIPSSVFSQTVRLELDAVEREILDAKLERMVTDTVEEMIPDAVALIVAEKTGLPHVAAIFLGQVFRRLFRFVPTR
jgi:hypothetical protein